RTLVYSGGGHPPALLLTGPSSDQASLIKLDSGGPMIGAVADLEFSTSTCQVDQFGLLFLYSDGVFEIAQKTDGKTWPFTAFVEFMRQLPPTGQAGMDRLVTYTRELGGSDEYVDDFSIVEFQFSPPA